MVDHRGLLERLAEPQKESQLSTKEDLVQLKRSILTHVRKILNTRQGQVLTNPDFGMPDFTQLIATFPESLKRIQNSIRSTIEKYEPRLKEVRINFVEDNIEILNLTFEIKAELKTERDATSIVFETMVSSTGKVSLKG